MISRIVLIVLASALGLLLVLGLLVGAGVFRIGPDGLEIEHGSDDSVAHGSGSENQSEDLWAKAYRERQAREHPASGNNPPATAPATSANGNGPAAASTEDRLGGK